MKFIHGLVLVLSISLYACEGDSVEVVDCDLLISFAGNENVGCVAGGEIVLEGSAGVEPYTYSFDESVFQESPRFSGVMIGGLYNAVVKDAVGCKSQTMVTVTGNEAAVAATLTMVNSPCGSSEGMISVKATGGDGNYSYKVDNGNFGSSNEFTGLSIGSHKVIVKDGTGCSNVQSIKILSGVSYDAKIKNMISNSCATSGCHVAGTGRENFTDFATIQSNAGGIKTRTQNKSMPPNGSLTDVQIQTIACWVDDGALNN